MLCPPVRHLVVPIFAVFWSRPVEVNVSAEQAWLTDWNLLGGRTKIKRSARNGTKVSGYC